MKNQWVKRCGLMIFLVGIVIMFAEVVGAKYFSPLPEEVAVDQTKAAVQDYVGTRLLKNPEDIDVTNINPILSISASDHVSVRQGGGTDNRGLVGRSVFLIGVTPQNGEEHQHWVSADVSVIRKVWMATRLIKRHETLTPDAFSMETIYQTRLEEQYIDTETPIWGKQASRMILPGEPLVPDKIQEVAVIKRGERVTLIVEKDGVRITAMGRAKENGFIGKSLAVVPFHSNEVIYGTVVDESTVQVMF